MKRWVTIIRSQGNYFRRSLSLIFFNFIRSRAAPAATDAATVATAAPATTGGDAVRVKNCLMQIVLHVTN
jgi:hypothetical protein